MPASEPKSLFPSDMTDDDFKRMMLGALRLLTILAAVGGLILWWKMGWQSAVLLVVGAAISGSSLWEWLRLMSAVMIRMDASGAGGEKPAPMGMLLVSFFLRMGLVVAVLYVSLKYLNGSALALAAGLGLGVLALSIEGLRLMKQWTA